MSAGSQGARVPDDDEDRVNNLRSFAVLDTEPEEAFDRLTRLVSALLDMPIALVSLIDGERQWFKSRVGLDVHETPRELAFCGHAILDDRVFAVQDASQDDRFAENPLVTGDPRIRFYAGAPLTTRQGHNVGTLCVIDRKPRSLDDAQMQILTDFAALATRELELHKAAATDGLTGVLNRAGLIAAGGGEFARARRLGSPLAVALLDVDSFKAVNDRYGHAGGDIALRRIAEICAELSRPGDVIGRLGGDEFGVIYPDCSAVDAAVRAEQVLARVRTTPWLPGTGGDPISVSIGVAEVEDHEPNLAAAWVRADTALYRAKETRDAVVV